MSDLVGVLIGAIIGLLIAFVILAIITLVFQWLWNTTMPDVFGVKSLTLGQAFKILLISAILFGGGTKVIERGHEVVPDDAVAQTTG